MAFDFRFASMADIDALVALEQDCFTLDRLSPRNFNWMVRRANASLIVAEQQGIWRATRCCCSIAARHLPVCIQLP